MEPRKDSRSICRSIRIKCFTQKCLEQTTFDIEFTPRSVLRKYDSEEMRKQLNTLIQNLVRRRDVMHLRVFRDFIHVRLE